jgi:hypothetical protein
MSDEDQKDLIRRLAYHLDACMPYLKSKAAQEKRQEAGKALRRITDQKLAARADEALKDAFDLLGEGRP